MGIPLRVLMVEDSEDDVALLLRELRHGGYDVSYERVDTPAAMNSALATPKWDIVISDHSMPHFSGVDALKILRSKGSEVPLIFVSGTIGEDAAVSALKDGAQDYLMKANLKRLVPAIQRELREGEERRERKRLEQQLRQAQKMEAIGQLAGGIAHDFNNLLGVIIGYSEMLLEQMEGDAPTRKPAEEINRAGKRAASLTRQLLAFSRRQVLEPKVMSLNVAVTEVEIMLQRLIGEDVNLQTSLDPAIGSVKADPGQIEQVILNLVVNARDAMPRGGKLLLETSNVELDGRATKLHPPMFAGQFVVLTVTDTGIGMDSETQAHIFEPFFTTKELGKGTGLGLATVYGVVRQSGGFVRVHSEPGQGAQFKVYLPLVQDTVETRENRSGHVTNDFGTETILLAEDSEPLRELICMILRNHGYTVLEAGDGAAALRIANQHSGPIHLLVTDVIMPGIGGHELSESLKSMRRDLRVLYVSGYTDDTMMRHGVSDANVAILPKPFTPKDLTRKVRDVLDAEKNGMVPSEPGSHEILSEK
jgi:two-component system cell cycle sensor histidine kinase/response regulator CckA